MRDRKVPEEFATPLVKDNHDVSLYDPICMLDLSREVASGYLILLMGGPTEAKRTHPGNRDRDSLLGQNLIDDGAVTLAFLALTSGNVLNAVFGAPAQHLPGASSPAHLMAQQAKNALSDAADTSDGIRRLAVETYASAFRIIIDFNERMGHLSPCSRCWEVARLRRTAQADLQVAFKSLSEAIVNSTSE